MATERKTDHKSSGMRSRNSTGKEPGRTPAASGGSLERHRPADAPSAKTRQAFAQRPAGQQARRESQSTIRKKRRKKLIIRLAVTLFVILICVLCFLFTFRVFYDTAVNEEDTSKVEITITDPEITDEEVAEMLKELGCIKDVSLYKLRTFIYDANYIPGTYTISPSYTTEKIINILSGYDYSDGTMEE